MKLFYNPAFTGSAYVDFKKSPVFFDSKIVNTAGLCNVIRLHAGICSDVADYGTRFVHYYAAMKKYMAKNPKSVMAASFKVDQLNTAKKCLEWRDTLAADGWTKAAPAPTERMKTLCGIEEYFTDKSDGEALLELITQVEDGCPLPQMEIIVSEYYEDFAPAEVRLLKTLIERGVNFTAVKADLPDNNIGKVYSILEGKKGVELDPADDSFEIWNFAERDEAIKYLSLLDADNFDVWINAENKEFDNWQKLEGKRLSGSEISGIPHTAQLLNIALTIFERPLNVKNIVEWLNTSPNPLAPGFRKGLASCICDTGGFYNDSCREYIANYIKEYPKSEDSIQKFIPDINHPYFEESELEVSEIKEFIKNLRDWCYKEMSNKHNTDPGKDQLGFVAAQAENLLNLLDNLETQTIPYDDIAQITAAFTTDHSMTQYTAQAGSKKVITSYSDFCDVAEKTVWCDFYNCGNSPRLTYSFLVPAEAQAFKEVLPLWPQEHERDYLKNLLLIPFAKTRKKLVLVTIDKIDSANAPKSPVYIQLEKYDIAPFIKQMTLDDSLKKTVKKIDNRMESEQEFVQISKNDYIKEKWPDHQSSSNLEKVIPWPLDYVVNNFARFSSNAVDCLADLYTTEGNIAHRIIEILFAPTKEVKGSGTPSYIKKQIEERFEEVFQQIVQAEGAILLIKENRQELKQFKIQVKSALEELLKGIFAKELHVVACEKKLEDKVEKLKVNGKVDMILADPENNFYIFDFKWSSTYKHANKLRENKSVQFALYKELVEKEYKVTVKAVAYFIISEARFISCQNFLSDGINLQQVYVSSERKAKKLLKELQNTYEYRKEQIFDGSIEETSDFVAGSFGYDQIYEEQELFPTDYYYDSDLKADCKKGPYPDENIDLLKSRK
ncbi:MAG: hypothetical protein J5710_04010 [Treponema sp.]|nr:hypothetical protein [Treponema sp.]MBR5647309.1 hypothetical protein [Treponema sp.]